MTTKENQPEWMTLQEIFYKITEYNSIEYNFNINSLGDCVVWLTKMNTDTKVMYKTKPKYFSNTDDACQYMQKQSKEYCEYMKRKIKYFSNTDDACQYVQKQSKEYCEYMKEKIKDK